MDIAKSAERPAAMRHSILAAALYVLLTHVSYATPSDETPPVHGHKVEVAGPPEIAGSGIVTTNVNVSTLPAHSDVENDPLVGWRYTWLLDGEPVGVEEQSDGISPSDIPSYQPKVEDAGKKLRLRLSAKTDDKISYPFSSSISDEVMSNEIEVMPGTLTFRRDGVDADGYFYAAGIEGVEVRVAKNLEVDLNTTQSGVNPIQWRITGPDAEQFDINSVQGSTGWWKKVILKSKAYIEGDDNIYLATYTATNPLTQASDSIDVKIEVLPTVDSALAFSSLSATWSNANVLKRPNIGQPITVSHTLDSSSYVGEALPPLYKWYLSDTPTGTKAQIAGASSASYTPRVGDYNKYITVSVKPQFKDKYGNIRTGKAVELRIEGSYGNRVANVIRLSTGEVFLPTSGVVQQHHLKWNYCRDLTYEGESNWTMPTRAQLTKLYNAYNNVRTSYGWTLADNVWASESAPVGINYYYVNMFTGVISYEDPYTGANDVTCVLQ